MNSSSFLKSTMFIVSFLLIGPSLFSQSWNAMSTGTNGTVYATIVFNGELIAAGSFTSAGGVSANNIARWNGSTWSSLGSGTSGTVYGLTIFNGQLVAVGSFTTAGGVTVNNIARWSGNAWSGFGLGTNNTIYCVTVYNSQLRIGGNFTNAGGIAVNRVARYDGTSWGTMGTGLNNTAYGMATRGTELIITGAFTTAGGITCNRVTRYNGSGGTYATMGLGIDTGTGYTVTLYNNNAVVAGNFTHIGGIAVNYMASWNGSNWSTFGSGFNGSVRSLAVNGPFLYAGGTFTNAGGTSANCIAVWNGYSWANFGSGMSGGASSVNAISPWSAVLVAGGTFTSAGGVSANNIAAYGSLPAAPNLLSPPDGSTGQSTSPTLDWTDVSSSSAYGVQSSLNPNFTTYVFNITGLSTSQYLVNPPLQNNTTYFWRANASNGLGQGPFSSIWFFTTAMVGIINTHEIPETFRMYDNYPNPFNPVTKIRFDLPEQKNASTLKLTIYDINGKVVSELLNTTYVAGKWEMDFDAFKLNSGVYLCKLEAGQYIAVQKLMLIK